VIPATVYPSHPHLLHPHHQETTVTAVRDPFPSPLPHKRSLRVALVLTAALALAVVASGCGDDNEASAAQPGSGHHADDPPTIEVKATDCSGRDRRQRCSGPVPDHPGLGASAEQVCG
jgi:hypothetical protein